MTAPALPKTYRTVRWGDDMDPNGADTDSDLESLEQDVEHIIEQVVGSNLADPDKGVGAVNYLNGTVASFQKMPAIIDAQLRQVDRIAQSSSRVEQQADGSWIVAVTIVVGGQVVNLQFAVGPNGLTRQS